MIISTEERDRRILLAAAALNLTVLEVAELVSWIQHDHPRPSLISERIASRLERGPISITTRGNAR